MSAPIVVVAGAIANKPGNGGEVWVRTSWIRGFALLGFDVWFVEELAEFQQPEATDLATAWFRSMVALSGIADRSVLLCGDATVGPLSLSEVLDLVASSVMVVNISGNLRRQDVFGAAPKTVYVDLDPGYTQIWHQTGVGDLRLEDHDVHVTVGANIGRSGCDLPTGGFEWIPVRQPVILDDWPVAPPVDGPFTTVTTWRCPFGRVSWAGVDHGMKLHEFRRIVDLPTKAPQPLEIAVAMYEQDRLDREMFESYGWRIRDAHEVASTPYAFRNYVATSAGEFSPAQGVYAHSACGWFSDRTTRYLASGRPAVVQETGIAASGLPVGEGLITYSTVRSALDALKRIADEPERHAAAALQIAEEHFEARSVLSQLVERIGP